MTIERHRTGAFMAGRRAFLAGVGGTVLALPFLESIHGPARAAAGVPRRFIVWQQGQGTQWDQWATAGASDTDFTLGPILQPLADYRDRLALFHGIDNRAAKTTDGDGHTSAQKSVLCATPNSGGASIDQLVWDRIHTEGQRSPLHLAVGPTARVGRFLSAANEPTESVGDPLAVWDSTFASFSVPDDVAARRRRRRVRSLDAVRESFAALRARIPTEDRDRLDRHAAHLDEVETRLQSSVVCAPPTRPGTYDAVADWTRAADDMFDLTIANFACDLSPVVTLEWTNDHDPAIFAPYLGGYSNWHEMVHSGESMRGIAGLRDGYRFYTERFARLLDKLRTTPEPMGDGTMLDHTLILMMGDLGYGAGHNKHSILAALAGTLGAGVPMGRMLRFVNPEDMWTESDWCTNNLFTSVLHAFGATDVSHVGFSDPSVRTGPIPGLIG